ncbi:type VI secretion system tube protein Hcp, partial [Klebsiella pneumoniae]|nr:type VI secretion system tube protein Hcp [Klebsiella pneumoniae]
GRGDTGVVRKTDKAVAALTVGIQEYLLQHASDGSCTIKEIQFDIFGFSRGAGAARHFANRVFSQDRAIITAIRAGLNGIEFSGAPGGKTRFL